MNCVVLITPYKLLVIILLYFYQRTLFTLIDCAEADATAVDKSGENVMKESDYYCNQTFNVYDQEVALVGSGYENKTERFHSPTGN